MFVTFYSYKGGVGRTLALANAAYLLATSEDSLRVLMWDFDLEAPGLQQIFKETHVNQLGGFVDMVTEYAQKAEMPDVSDYIVKTSTPGLDLLPAGKMGKAYSKKLEKLNWQDLYNGFYGWEFIEKVKDDIQSLKYDYVLIDSRTGYSDVGGICTQQLPDLVVLLFRLNDQNIAGSSQVSKAIKSWSKKRANPISLIPVISPAWPFASEQANQLIQRATKLFSEANDTDRSQIAHATKKVGNPFHFLTFDSALAFGERLLSKEQANFSITPRICEDYQALTRTIRVKNPNDPTSIRRLAGMAERRDDYSKAFGLYVQLVSRHPDNLREWRRLLEFIRGAPAKVEKDLQSQLESLLKTYASNGKDGGYLSYAEAELAFMQEDFQKAIRFYSLSIDQLAEPEIALWRRTLSYAKEKKFDLVVADTTELIKRIKETGRRLRLGDHPEDVVELNTLYRYRAEALLNQHHYSEALEDLESIINSSDVTPHDVIKKAHALAGLGDTERAKTEITNIEKILRGPNSLPDISDLLETAECLIVLRELDRARSVLSDVLSLPVSSRDHVIAEILTLIVECLKDHNIEQLAAQINKITRKLQDRPLRWSFIELNDFFGRELGQDHFTKEQIQKAQGIVSSFEQTNKKS